MTFADLGLSEPILRAVGEQGYNQPSPVQAKAVPAVLTGRDVMAAAQTGTGKTAGFTLPLLHRLSTGEPSRGLSVRALVLTPTRELAAQVGESVEQYGRHLPLRSTVVFGGVKINPQIAALQRGVDVLVATPGRLLDLHQQRAVSFDKLEILVLDEADRMLDMGFIHDIRKIVALLPRERQTLMFSATFSDDIRKLAGSFLQNPLQIEVSPRNATAQSVKQWVYPVDKARKGDLLCHLVHAEGWEQVLIFTRTKHGANRLAQKLDKDGIRSAAIHGNKSQGARTRALADFKNGRLRALVATDIAARGLDIEQLPQVVNFELPNVPEDYVHRIGRTGRAGAQGRALSLVSADEIKQLTGIERLIRKNLVREFVDGFEPDHNLPESHAPRAAAPARRPQGERRSGPGDNRGGRGRSRSGRGGSGGNSRGNGGQRQAR